VEKAAVRSPGGGFVRRVPVTDKTLGRSTHMLWSRYPQIIVLLCDEKSDFGV